MFPLIYLTEVVILISFSQCPLRENEKQWEVFAQKKIMLIDNQILLSKTLGNTSLLSDIGRASLMDGFFT